MSTDNVDFESKAYSLFTVEKNDIQRQLKQSLTEGYMKAMKGAPRKSAMFSPLLWTKVNEGSNKISRKSYFKAVDIR